MDTLRFFGLAALMFAAAFMGMNWFLRVEPLKPDPRLPTFQRVEGSLQVEQSSVSDGDPTRDKLRHDVLDYAKALGDDPCNPQLKRAYIKTVIAYARAWLSIAPCVGTRTCGSSLDSQRLDRAQHAFGSPLDVRVREAMARVHAKHIFGPADFPRDTVSLVAEMAADDSINSPADTQEFRRLEAQLNDSDDSRPPPVCGQ